MYAPPCSWRTGTKSIDESASDSLRSSVSSPGMPNTCRTPSASRHSTNTSDALRVGTDRTIHTRYFHGYAALRQRRYRGRRPLAMRRILLLTALLAGLAMPASAGAQVRWVTSGAGYGHGI